MSNNNMKYSRAVLMLNVLKLDEISSFFIGNENFFMQQKHISDTSNDRYSLFKIQKESM